jgi:hypothetical protein
MPNAPTFSDLLIKSIKSRAIYDPMDETPPVAILWFDGGREWESIIAALSPRLPILTLGPYNPSQRSGPASWIRCMISRLLNDRIAKTTIPVIYLPGISREEFLVEDQRSKELNLLADIIYSSVTWTTSDQLPWTVLRFFVDANEGPGIQVRPDDKVNGSIVRALIFFSDYKVSELKSNEPWKFKDFDSLVAESSIEKLILLNESVELEFKSTCHWDMVNGCKNGSLEINIIKTIAGFLNSSIVGTLIIGVDDQKNICGIEMDLQTFEQHNRNCDYYEQHVMRILLNAVGNEFVPFIHLSFYKVNDRTVCKVLVDPAPKPAIVGAKDKKEEAFYLRVGNATNSLSFSDAFDYYKIHWASA